MKTSPCHASTCRNCRFFKPEGSFHGNCTQLQVPVDADWTGCQLSTPAFVPIDELLDQLKRALQEKHRIEVTSLTAHP
jgi:hypothetical protein